MIISTSKSESDIYIDHLLFRYGKTAEKWEGQYRDDRQLFCIILRKLVEAYTELKLSGIENNSIWHGLNNYRVQEEEVLKRIMKKFKEEEST